MTTSICRTHGTRYKAMEGCPQCVAWIEEQDAEAVANRIPGLDRRVM